MSIFNSILFTAYEFKGEIKTQNKEFVNCLEISDETPAKQH
jgi:hypothetical protein